MDNVRSDYVLTPEGHRKTVSTGKIHVNVNAGIIQMVTPGGVKVCMYVDRPGYYYTIKGEPVPEKVAEMAGFETEILARQRDLQADQARAKEMLRDAMVTKAMKLEAKRGAFALYSIGNGLAVVHKDGVPLTDQAAPFAAMQELFNAFAAEAEDEEPVVFKSAQTKTFGDLPTVEM